LNKIFIIEYLFKVTMYDEKVDEIRLWGNSLDPN
jgi:hypothetical protein